MIPIPAPENHPADLRFEFFTNDLEQAVADLIAVAEILEVLEPPELWARLRDVAAGIARRQGANDYPDQTISEPGSVAG